MASSLTLEVAGPEARRLGNSARKVFTSAGGSIGRLPDNSWVLPDQHISGRHAVIRYSNGTYYVVDTSSNGVFLNSPDARLQKNQPQPLKNGDRLYIDTYEIRVSIRTDAQAESVSDEAYIADDPFADDLSGSTAAPLPAQPVAVRSLAAPARLGAPLAAFAALPNAEVDPMKLLGLSAPPAAPSVPKAEDLLRGSPLSNAYRPPPVRIAEVSPSDASGSGAASSSSMIPTGYNPLAPEEPVTPPSRAETRVERRPSAPAVVAAATSLEPTPGDAHTTQTARADAPANGVTVSNTNSEFTALLAAAGIEHATATPEVIESFGRILRIVVSGTMDLLRVREGVKDEFRMKMTTFKASDNNPLKFSANVEDALHNLLVKRNPAYLPPVEAFRDAFQDARNHQVAMFEGLRAAFGAMLREFDPQALEDKFEKQAKGSLLSGRRRYWELYREWYDSVAQDADSAFRTLFGEEFARAYEQQLQRLKNSGRS